MTAPVHDSERADIALQRGINGWLPQLRRFANFRQATEAAS